MTIALTSSDAGADAAAESLAAAVDRVHRTLAAKLGVQPEAEADPQAPAPGEWHPFAQLRRLFGLTAFERDVVILCAGFELERRFSSVLAQAGGERTGRPTPALALTVLDDPHWSAVTPASPLRHWRLVELGPGNLLDAQLALDERVLEFVLGVPALDGRLARLLRPIAGAGGPAAGTDDRAAAIDLGVVHWSRSRHAGAPLLLIARDRSTCESAFLGICRELERRPYALEAGDLPADPAEREELARLWTREAILGDAAVLVRTERCERVATLAAWLEEARLPVALDVRPGSAAEELEGVRVHLGPVTPAERRELWRRDLGDLAASMDGELDRIVEYFDFDETDIRATAARVRDAAPAGDESAGTACWRACREHARRSLHSLAQRIDVVAAWEELVLPEAQSQTLRQIVVHARRRAVVNDQWGFAAKHPRGLGLSVLFAGPSGTGKTMAAEIVAGELDLDLYKVDLASVVSKWVGETEKNLRAIFAGAARSGCVLLFDEADALFGKRSEVRDSHDRYANLEISYLLAQMEAYRGIAILTTNMPHALDAAFMRRIRFIVRFPFPDPAGRADIWRRIFPAVAPVGELDYDALARLNVSGGAIRNIALGAAFLAADEPSRIEARHILAAARTEYGKLEKTLTAAETVGLT